MSVGFRFTEAIHVSHAGIKKRLWRLRPINWVAAAFRRGFTRAFAFQRAERERDAAARANRGSFALLCFLPRRRRRLSSSGSTLYDVSSQDNRVF